MKTQQRGTNQHRGLITLTTTAFLAAAVLTAGCVNTGNTGSTGTTGASGPLSRHDILSAGQSEVSLQQNERHSGGENLINPEAITAEHNRWRSQVGVPELRWSDKLANAAQDWADTLKEKGCGFYHSNNGYGENLFMSSARIRSDGTREVMDVKPQDAVDSWGNESRDYNYAENSCSGVCGHYTQVVWKETQEVGCAKTVCDDKSQVWVCSYAPAGNRIGKRPY
ncbi:MAG: CAP domain-containing protein [Candidatus Electrothrix aestuarii]|jgi:pathogenesis-related protein 1|uniref:CAP domain-containing protein n=1 Tax=Candidatus Electrothrix aestuarii TaxID=3062594 RepID=A0AAU8LTX0_9BACT|nr:CAP domain-containing protein [Candidatus Electrothrix aestuarii]